MTPDPAESAKLALFCAEAEAVGPVSMPPMASQQPEGAVITGGPPLPPWIAKDHSLLGWISGMDALFQDWLNIGARRVFFGWAIEGDDGVTVAIRGTEDAAEWMADATFLPKTAHGVRGCLETGFANLSDTLLFRSLAGADSPLADAFTAPTTVTGHSLGAPLAEYLTLALAERDITARGRYFASPRPGDSTFAAYFASKVTDYACYAYERDLVPRVPAGLGYSPVGNVITLPVNPLVPDNPASWHHAGNYAWLIWPQSLELLPEAERTYPR